MGLTELKQVLDLNLERQKILEAKIAPIREELSSVSEETEKSIFEYLQFLRAETAKHAEIHYQKIHAIFADQVISANVHISTYRNEKYSSEYPDREICETALSNAWGDIYAIRLRCLKEFANFDVPKGIFLGAFAEEGLPKIWDALQKSAERGWKIEEPSSIKIKEALMQVENPFFDTEAAQKLRRELRGPASKNYFNVYGTRISTTPFYEGQNSPFCEGQNSPVKVGGRVNTTLDTPLVQGDA